MARSGRGGRRTPAQPAPVSGPGALARRTDGGPAQPTRVAPGGQYGARQAMESLQQAAPMAAGGGGQPSPSTNSPTAAPLPAAFAPTQRPNEPITAGLPSMPAAQSLAQLDADALLRLMIRRFPHPQLVRLLRG